MRLDYIVNQFSKTKINKCKPLIRCVLRMGTYEIFYMDSVQDHTACNLCVKLAADHGFGSLRGFVNGVLRDYDYETIDRILASGDSDRPTAIRVNTEKISVTAFSEKLRQNGITVERGSMNDTSLLISGYDYIRKVPGWRIRGPGSEFMSCGKSCGYQ